MTRTSAPLLIPITRDTFTAGDYAKLPDKVAEVVAHEPEPLRALWQEIARDGVVDAADGARLERGVLGHRRLLDGPQPSTLEAKFLAARLADGKVAWDPELAHNVATVLAAREQQMAAGKVFTGTSRAGHCLHTRTEGMIDATYEAFIHRMPPDLWGANLADYRGGEVRVTARDAQGRVIRQRERMITETPYSKLWYAAFGGRRPTNTGLPNDMTKVEEIVYDDARRAVAVKWEVLASDNATTRIDVGEIRFFAHKVRLADGSVKEVTKVELESEHRIDAIPGTLDTLEKIPVLSHAVRALTERIMRDYFGACVRRYQDVGAGRAEVRPAPAAGS